MTRDYGNRRSSRQKSNGPHQFLVICVTFLLGYFTASVVDIQTLSHWINNQVLAHDEQKTKTDKPAPQNAQLPPKPKFEFYTLLANEKTPNATNSANSNTTTARAPGNQVAATVVPTAKPNAQITTVPSTITASSLSKVEPAKAVKVAEGNPLPPTQTRKGAYLVQVAAFKARQDAEHMKGMLILKGFSVNVVPVTNVKGNWFRVVVGPYSNRGLAQNAQVNLAKNERLRGVVTSAGA